jgi:hypothetical protein
VLMLDCLDEQALRLWVPFVRPPTARFMRERATTRLQRRKVLRTRAYPVFTYHGGFSSSAVATSVLRQGKAKLLSSLDINHQLELGRSWA